MILLLHLFPYSGLVPVLARFARVELHFVKQAIRLPQCTADATEPGANRNTGTDLVSDDDRHLKTRTERSEYFAGF